MKFAIPLTSLLLVALVIFFAHINKASDNECNRYAHPLLEKEHPTPPLKKLFNLTNLPEANNLNDIVSLTQAAWIRKPGLERWHLENSPEDVKKMHEFTECFKALGLFDETPLTKKHYDYAIVLGATLSRVRTRLAHLIELHNKGITFDEVIFLGGQRPLDPAVGETIENLKSIPQNVPLKQKDNWQMPQAEPKTESDMMRLVYEQTELPFSSSVKLIDTPMQHNQDGSLRRPNTGDTFASWLNTKPTPGNCLVVSNQPYVGYQAAVARTYLPVSFSIETTGHAKYNDINVPVLLDTVARWLYQLQLLNNKG